MSDPLVHGKRDEAKRVRLLAEYLVELYRQGFDPREAVIQIHRDVHSVPDEMFTDILEEIEKKEGL